MKTHVSARRRGASLTSYGLVVGLIAILAIAAVSETGEEVAGLLGSVGGEMESVAADAGAGGNGAASEDGAGHVIIGDGDDSAPYHFADDGGTGQPGCQAYLGEGADAVDGVYALTVSGTDFNAWCDMTSDGGGWTLAMRMSSADGSIFIYDADYWDTANTVNDAVAAPAVTNTPAEAKYAAYNLVAGDEMRAEFTDPDVEMNYSFASSGITLLTLFSAGPAADNINLNNGSCNPNGMAGHQSFDGSIMRLGQGNQYGGINAVWSGAPTTHKGRFGFAGNDEAGEDAKGIRHGIGLPARSAGWSPQQDCVGGCGCYGTEIAPADYRESGVNLWIR